KLDGNIRLKRQTESLTTLTASAYRGMTHEVSVEQAIVKAIHQASERTNPDASFSFQGYRKVYEQPDTSKKYLAWFRPGSMLHVKPSKQPGWLKIKLPSGENGYVKVHLSKDSAQ
ncbi:MAG: hypothetical protein R8K53_04770, partial [Mariprofundaceae bacterium]